MRIERTSRDVAEDVRVATLKNALLEAALGGLAGHGSRGIVVNAVELRRVEPSGVEVDRVLEAF